MTENQINILEVQGEEFSQDKDKYGKETEIMRKKISCTEDPSKIESQNYQNSTMRGQNRLNGSNKITRKYPLVEKITRLQMDKCQVKIP